MRQAVVVVVDIPQTVWPNVTGLLILNSFQQDEEQCMKNYGFTQSKGQ